MHVFLMIIGPCAPPRLVVVSTTDTTALLKWQRPQCCNRKGELLFYKLIFKPVKGSAEDSTKESWLKGIFGSQLSYEVTGLTPNTMYKVQIATKNDFGLGRWAPAVSFKTKSTNVSDSRKLFLHLHLQVLQLIIVVLSNLCVLCRYART